MASLVTSLSVLDDVALQGDKQSVVASSRFEKLLEGEDEGIDEGRDGVDYEEKEMCILSQEFFSTPDYITPDAQPFLNTSDFDKENTCPKSPIKSTYLRNKRHKQANISADDFLIEPICDIMDCDQQIEELKVNQPDSDKFEATETTKTAPYKPNYVPQSAVALRCRVMPPPCLRNPFANESDVISLDIFHNRKSKLIESAFGMPIVDGGLSRYRTDFHEIEQIGSGSFSLVFKALKRIDGCMYAVKHGIRQLHDDALRRQALMEVQSLAALGFHENIVGYHTSWFENEKLYIQMELCDHSLSFSKSHILPKEEIFEVLYQMAKALQFIHKRGIAHLDLKPENIYIKNGIYKLGDFGFATSINKELPIEEGDSRYMPLEILNENYDHLDKVDIFSLGATTYELARGSTLPKSGSQFMNLREGKISLLPGYSLQFQNLIKTMMDPNPLKRPTAKQVLENSLFSKSHPTLKSR